MKQLRPRRPRRNYRAHTREQKPSRTAHESRQDSPAEDTLQQGLKEWVSHDLQSDIRTKAGASLLGSSELTVTYRESTGKLCISDITIVTVLRKCCGHLCAPWKLFAILDHACKPIRNRRTSSPVAL